MAKKKVVKKTEKTGCKKCDADIRENTSFCYNCGTSLTDDETTPTPEVAPEIAPEIEPESNDEHVADAKTRTALDDLAERLRLGEEADNKLAKAAAERKKARVVRKPREFTWESSEETPNGMLMIAALLITLLAGIVVLLTVLWK